MGPEVSVVIPTYNRPALLRRAVGSAVAQVDVRLEVIVVDDGIARPVADGELPEGVLMVRAGGGGGVAPARNLGVERARGPWIAFLDDDDWWAPDHVHRLLSAVDGRDAGFAYAATWNVDLSRGEAVLRPAPPPDGLVSLLLRENALGTPSCVMVRRSLYQGLGGFDEGLSVLADWDLWIRMAAAAPGAVSRIATVAYAAHDENMSLDFPRILDEFNRLSARYGSLCEREQIRFGAPGFPRWIAHMYRRQGQRLPAAAWYLRSARIPGRRVDVLRALGVLGGERAMSLVGGAGAASLQTPPSWVGVSQPLDAHSLPPWVRS